jgi:hypothetical protein
MNVSDIYTKLVIDISKMLCLMFSFQEYLLSIKSDNKVSSKVV